MPRYRARVAYDGTAYYGFQRQRQEPTVQGQIEAALSHLARQPVTILGAGRTDSGVHALGQVIAFDLVWRHGPDALLRALNVNLPVDIAILKVESVDAEFHPRFDARRRKYEYRIYNAPIRHPLRRRLSWHVRQPLALAEMRRATAVLLGRHDFATFGTPPQGDNTVRRIFHADWQRQGEMLVFEVEANAFLYRMVRSLVGSLKAVGDGSWDVEAFVEAFHAHDRSHCATVAPPQGLFLVAVTYTDEE